MNNIKKKKRTSSSGILITISFSLVFFQSFVITYLLTVNHNVTFDEIQLPSPIKSSPNTLQNDYLSYFPSKETKPKIKYEGVATTLFLNTPKWFQRRYTNMITNVFINIPPNWAIQIFCKYMINSNVII